MNWELLGLSISLVSTILWGIYVYYTIRTFREIQQQTNLLQSAFIVSRIEFSESSPELVRKIPKSTSDLNSKWKKIIHDHINDFSSETSLLLLELTNRGKADVTRWKIDYTIDIEPGDFLSEEFNIRGEHSKAIIVSDHSNMIGPDQKILVAISHLMAFPKATFKWSITYEDCRNNNVENKSPINEYVFTNNLIYNKIRPKDNESSSLE